MSINVILCVGQSQKFQLIVRRLIGKVPRKDGFKNRCVDLSNFPDLYSRHRFEYPSCLHVCTEIGIYQFSAQNKPCSLKRFVTGLVCVCNATYCDTLDDDTLHPTSIDQILAITSSEVSIKVPRASTRT